MYKMSLVALASLSVLVAMASSEPTPLKIQYDVTNARPLFEDFEHQQKREYNDDADRELHYRAFVKDLQKLNELNGESSSAIFNENANMASSKSTPLKTYYDVTNVRLLELENKYISKYNDDADRELNFQAFVKDLQKLNELNEESLSAIFGINKFADNTDKERNNMHEYKNPVLL